MALLEVDELSVRFGDTKSSTRALDRVSFSIEEGETLGVVGESGCGKSVTALSILQLLPTPPATYDHGAIRFRGTDLLRLTDKEMQRVRGNQISMIFQEPMTSLNPVYTVGFQIIEAVKLHQDKTSKEARLRAIELLTKVGIPSPERNVDSFPHQLSGGMRQRVMIAMALACEPRLLIADEPTTALDVTIQAQILELIADLQKEFGMSVMLITHDLSVVAEYTKNLAVMYAGQIVEKGRVDQVFANPRHPYTRGLLQSLPGRGAERARRTRLPVIEGMVPDMKTLGGGCHFYDRCGFATDECKESTPPLVDFADGHKSLCFHAKELS